MITTSRVRLWVARKRVRLALGRADGTAERERAIIDAYDALVEREPRLEWDER
jgi:hypothetical protein